MRKNLYKLTKEISKWIFKKSWRDSIYIRINGLYIGLKGHGWKILRNAQCFLKPQNRNISTVKLLNDYGTAVPSMNHILKMSTNIFIGE